MLCCGGKGHQFRFVLGVIYKIKGGERGEDSDPAMSKRGYNGLAGTF